MDPTAPIGMDMGVREIDFAARRVMDTAYCNSVIEKTTDRTIAAIDHARIDPKALQSLHNVVLNELAPIQRLAKNQKLNGAKPSHDNVIRASAAIAMIGAQYEKLAQAERGINPGGNTQINIQIVAPAPVSPEIVDAEFRLKE